MSLNLTREEIDEITDPLVQNSAKVRYLRGLGLTVQFRPDGAPLVCRENYLKIMGGQSESAPKDKPAEPNWAAMWDGFK